MSSSIQLSRSKAPQNISRPDFVHSPIVGKSMRVLVVIALPVATMFMLAFVLINLTRDLLGRDLLGHSHHAAPEMDDSNDWDAGADQSGHAAQPEVASTERRTSGAYAITGSANALDDLHSAL
jgi:hypothetical protein